MSRCAARLLRGGLVIGLLGFLIPPGFLLAQTVGDPPAVVPGEILLLGRVADPRSRAPGTAPLGFDVTTAEAVRERVRRSGIAVREARPLTTARGATQAFPGGAWVLRLEDDEPIEDAILRLGTDPEIAYAGPNHVYTAPLDTATNDPLFDDQYALFLSRIVEVWPVTLGEGILVAVIDTGVELDHPDLATQIAINVTERDGLPGVDDDGNGYIDDIQGFDFTDAVGLPGAGDYLGRDNDPTDDVGHGTQVSGIVAAAHNDTGVAGVAPGARILAVRAGFRTRIPFSSGLLEEDDIAAAIVYAADRGAQILNLSFGGVADGPLMREAIRYARARGSLVISSAGNTSRDEAHFPGAYPGVLSVGASDRNDGRVSFSTFGQDLDLLAPGVSLLTTTITADYKQSSGTSFSAPIVAGAAALLWSVHPEWTADQIAWQLKLAARRTTEGWSPETGWGRLDVRAAFDRRRPPPVFGLEGVDHRDPGIGFRGTVLDPSLVSWSLSVVPTASAPAPGAAAFEEIVLESGRATAVQDRILATLQPTGAGEWLVRLTARVSGLPFLEERSRFWLPEGTMQIEDLRVEILAGAAGWDLTARWTSPELYQAAIRLDTASESDRFESTRDRNRSHGLRLDGPLAAGTWPLELWGRPGEQDAYRLLAEIPLTLPPAPAGRQVAGISPVFSGTPSSRVVDWNGNGRPDVLVEGTPLTDVYGDIYIQELTDRETITELGSSRGLFRGIPIDVADADGDGRQELVVFRLDAWSVWEGGGPSGFPSLRIAQFTGGGSVPLQFVAGPTRPLLLVTAGTELRLLAADPASGYAVVSTATGGTGALGTRTSPADVDGDGRLEIPVVNERGELVLFELDGETLRFEEVLTGPGPLAGPVLAVPGAGGASDLVTVEIDPPFLGEGGDLDRIAVILRRWRREVGGWTPLADLGFSGYSTAAELQLLAWEEQLLLRRNDRLDEVRLADDGLTWGGLAFQAREASVHGAAITDLSEGTVLWVGNSDRTGPSGELVALDAPGEPTAGSPLRVERIRGLSGGVAALDLAWETDGCSGAAVLSRSGTQRGTYTLAVIGRTAGDSVGIGEQVTFRAVAPGCLPRTVTVTGRVPAVPVPVWDATGRVLVDLDRPLARDIHGSSIPPRDVYFLRNGERVDPEALLILDEGRRLAMRPPEGAVDSVVVLGAWLEDRLPAGGAARLELPTPERPRATPPAILETVYYRGDPASLEVALGGADPGCALAFRMEPGGLAFPPVAFDTALVLDLPAPLEPGTYRVTLTGDCLEAGSLGQERSFRVGILVYPNPVPAGQPLRIENLEPGSRVELLDIGGVVREAWTVLAWGEKRALEDLAPGLYLLRAVSPRGVSLGVHRLALMR